MLWRNKNALKFTTIIGLGTETLKLRKYEGRPKWQIHFIGRKSQ